MREPILIEGRKLVTSLDCFEIISHSSIMENHARISFITSGDTIPEHDRDKIAQSEWIEQACLSVENGRQRAVSLTKPLDEHADFKQASELF